MKKLLIASLFVGIGAFSNAQADKHFSMFNESPMYLNPAAAGLHPGQMQAFTNFRMQWMTISPNPYQTISASVEGRFFDQGNGHLGAGLSFYNDVAGDGQFQINLISVPLNYAISLNADNYLSLGLQPGFYQRTINESTLTWESQWTGIAFDQSINSGEVLLNENSNIARFDMGAGIYWYGQLSKNKKISLGVSGSHLTKQRINFFGNDDKLYRKVTVHGSGEFKKMNSNLTYNPAFFAFVQGPNMEFALGSNFKFQLRGASVHTGYFDEVSLSFGAFYRTGDAIITNVLFDIAGFSVGASYDLNISKLTIASKGVGAFEAYLRYRFRFGSRSLANPRIN